MEHIVTLIPGDGIGPEVCACAERVVDASGAKVRWERVLAGEAAARELGDPLPDDVLDSIRRHAVALKGPVTTPIGGGFSSVTIALRRALNLYACLRPVQSIPGVPARYDGVDLVVIRENTEGLYGGLEHMVVPGVAQGLKIITEKASLRIADFAFRFARHRGRRRVTVVHKANIMKISDGLFLSCAERTAKKFPDIQFDSIIVDNCALQLVLNPQQFDVLLLDNLYGDVMSDLCAGLVGGLGVVPGANIGDEFAIFEAVHGSALDIAGKGIANPSALILSAAMMLSHLGEAGPSRRIERAVHAVHKKGTIRTPDLGGTASSTEFTDAVLREMSTGVDVG